MPDYMLDTNICIYIIKNKPETLRARFNDNADRLSISVITYMELIYGVERSTRKVENQKTVDAFCARLNVLPLTAKAADHAGQIRAVLAGKGMPIGPYDNLIAGHARSEGMMLVTNNMKEFSRVDGLLVENWLE